MTTQERTKPRLIRGRVVSDKMNKTRVMEVKRNVQHSMYHKNILLKTRIFFHDEKNESHVGDTVLAVAVRPLSKNKNFSLYKVVEKGITE